MGKGAIPGCEGDEKSHWLKTCLSGPDYAYDAARIVGVAGAAFYIVFWVAAIFHIRGATFTATDAVAYGSGLGTVLLSMATAVRIKSPSEQSKQDGDDGTK